MLHPLHTLNILHTLCIRSTRSTRSTFSTRSSRSTRSHAASAPHAPHSPHAPHTLHVPHTPHAHIFHTLHILHTLHPLHTLHMRRFSVVKIKSETDVITLGLFRTWSQVSSCIALELVSHSSSGVKVKVNQGVGSEVEVAATLGRRERGKNVVFPPMVVSRPVDVVAVS
ncbi:hypothetical protein RRG08_019508 [Elysia crispata]|uniref:Uncharacterized protein n=1 Tax=Elysia crispata TaxID=231223 RepID=A0AAE1D3N0_9GAST|nr:hypothetical protein RRG08_019508 [Elysia crispata]